MDEVNKIRKAFRTQGKSKYKIAKEFNRSWETIHRIVSTKREDLANRGKRPNRQKSVATSEVLAAVEGYIKEEKEKAVKRKQRYTAKKIYEELRAKEIYTGSYRRMQEIVKAAREKLGQSKKKAYLPLDFPLGSALQIDHGEADLTIDGDRFTGYLFIASVPGEVLRYAQIFPTKSREAWGEFHERALRFFGGSFPQITYDNDSVLIKKVIGSERKQTDFSHSLEEAFGFTSHFCNVAAGNEKGAVENAVGYCRRNFLPGCPDFVSWEKVNTHLETCCYQDIENGVHYKTKKPLAPVFEELKQKLGPLLPRKKWRKWIDCRVDSCQLVTAGDHQYSAPERYIGTNVRVSLIASEVEIFKDEESIATHTRQYGCQDSLHLDHYLDQLKTKPSALWDCKAVQAKNIDPMLMEMWRRMKERETTKEANREFIKILLLARRHSYNHLLEAVELALKYGTLNAATVENIIRQLETSQQAPNEEELRKRLGTDHPTWECNLTPYAELCEEVAC